MKKFKLFLAACAAMVGLSAQAQSWTASEVGAGNFMLYNVGKGQFLTRGNGWGTQASVSANSALTVTIEENAGAYKLRTNVNGNGKGLERLADPVIYTDQSDGKNSTWTFTKIADASNGPVYTIVSKDNHGGGEGSYMTASADNTIVGPADAVTDDYGRWQLLQSWITNSVPVNDVTGWTASQTPTFDGTNVCAEFWNKSGASIKQTVSNLPAGAYELIAVALTREGMTATLNAGSNTMSIATVSSSVVNGRGGANTWFNNGNGVNTLKFTLTEDTPSLEIGLTADNTTGDHWLVWRSFILIYKGDPLASAKAELAGAVANAQALEGTIPSAAYTAVADVVATNNKDYSTPEEYDAATSAIVAATTTAKALQANYTRYNNIKNAAKAIASATNTTDADAALAAATTKEAIDAAVATLRAAFLEELPNVTVPTDGLDVTAVMVDNASVAQNTNYWTAEENGTAKTSGSWAVCNYNECEFYNNNFKFYQTLALIKGSWEFGVTGFHRAGNHNTYFYAGGSKVLIPGVESSVVNNMADAKTYFDNGNGLVSVKFALDAAGNVEIGIDNQDTETDKWTIFRNFTLKYYGEAVDLSAYVAQLAEAVANAGTVVEGTLPASAYTSLNDVVAENNKEYSTVADYETAISNIETATANAKALVAPYAAYKTLNSAVQALYDVADYEELTTGAHDALGTALSTAASVIETKTTVDDVNAVNETLKVAGATYAGAANPTGTAKFDCTFLLTNPDVSGFASWTKVADVPGWYTDQPTDDGGNSQTMTNDAATSEDGTKTHFFEYWSNPAKANDAFALYQKVTLPAGTFDISCYAFAQDQYAGTNSVGVYFYANDTQGSAVTTARLTQAGISFVNTAEQEVKIGLKTIAGNSYNWMGIGYVELYKVPAKVVTIDENADYVAENAAATVELKRTIKANVWNTIVLPFQLNADELKAAFGDDVQIAEFSDAGESEAAVTVNFNVMATPAITPNKPVLLKTSTAGTEYTFEGRTVAAGEAKFAGTYVDFVGTYAASTTIAEGNYFISADKLYKSTGATTVKGTRAYIDAKNASAGVKLFIGGIETAISEINGDAAEQGAIFNLAGQRVNKAQKGVFIVNGKKVLVK